MGIFLRNLFVACLTMMALVGMLAAGAVLWLVLLVLIAAIMGYIALRKAGILNPPGFRNPPKSGNFDAEIIEAEYTVVSETERQIPDDRV